MKILNQCKMKFMQSQEVTLCLHDTSVHVETGFVERKNNKQTSKVESLSWSSKSSMQGYILTYSRLNRGSHCGFSPEGTR